MKTYVIKLFQQDANTNDVCNENVSIKSQVYFYRFLIKDYAGKTTDV